MRIYVDTFHINRWDAKGVRHDATFSRDGDIIYESNSDVIATRISRGILHTHSLFNKGIEFQSTNR